MPRYRYTSTWPEVFSDLEVGVNATVFPGDDREPAEPGSTVVLLPGDEIETAEPYIHAHLIEAADNPTPAEPPAALDAPQEG